MFNLQGTLLAASSTHSHPWLTMGGSNRAVAVPKCLSWSGFPCGEQLFLIVSSVSSRGMGGSSEKCCGLADGADAGHLPRASTTRARSWHLAGYGEQQHVMLRGCT